MAEQYRAIYNATLRTVEVSEKFEQGIVVHNLPAASHPPLPEACSDNKISISA